MKGKSQMKKLRIQEIYNIISQTVSLFDNGNTLLLSTREVGIKISIVMSF